MSVVGFSVVRVLPELDNKPWNAITKAYMRTLRPSNVRIVPDGQPMTSDAVLWRVTVHLSWPSGLIRRIEQEVEVDLPDGIRDGYDLQCALESNQAT